MILISAGLIQRGSWNGTPGSLTGVSYKELTEIRIRFSDIFGTVFYLNSVFLSHTFIFSKLRRIIFGKKLISISSIIKLSLKGM